MGKTKAVPITQLLETLYADLPPYRVMSDMLQAKVATAIANARIERKMNQKEFAEYMGVTQSQVSKWENGCFNFTIEKLCEIADKLDLTFEASLKKKPSKPVKCDTKGFTYNGNVIHLASYLGNDCWSGKSFSVGSDFEDLKEM